MHKIYRFTQTMDNYQEPYYTSEGTLETILYLWFHNAAQRKVGLFLDSNKESYTKEKQKIKEFLDKQSYFCEIVDKDCYGIGWVTKIDEIKS